jgi:hypothetical protein
LQFPTWNSIASPGSIAARSALRADTRYEGSDAAARSEAPGSFRRYGLTVMKNTATKTSALATIPTRAKRFDTPQYSSLSSTSPARRWPEDDQDDDEREADDDEALAEVPSVDGQIDAGSEHREQAGGHEVAAGRVHGAEHHHSSNYGFGADSLSV